MAGNKLTAKAAKLDFSSLPGMPGQGAAAGVGSGEAGLVPVGRPKTAPGAMMAFANDARSELLRENEDLRRRANDADGLRAALGEALGELEQWEGAKAARLLSAGEVVPSAYANRHERAFDTPDYAALKREIENAGGNVQPIKVRPLPAGRADGARYEVVFGHRRHRACLELGLPVLAVVDNLDDRALFVEMERENRARKDLSAWEQGQMYRRALRLGLFPSNRKLAEAIGVDLSALGKALSLADLPDEVVRAFASPLDLQFRWAKPLSDALSSRREQVLAQARALAGRGHGLSAKAVLDRLLSVEEAGKGVEPFHPPAERAVQVGGRSVGSVRVDAQGRVSLTLDPGVLSRQALSSLVEAVQRVVAQAQPGPREAAEGRR